MPSTGTAGKGLGGGLLGSSPAIIYQPSTGQSCVVNELFISNGGASTETCTFVTSSGGRKHVVLLADEEASIYDNEETLSLAAGDALYGNATNPNVVSYKIGGVTT